MKQKITFFKVFLTLVLLCGVGNAWASDTFVELCTSWNETFAYASSYTHDYTIDNLNGGTTTMGLAVKGVYRQGNANTYFQMNKNTGYFKNTTKLPGRITKIVTTWSAAKGATKCYFANNAEASSSDEVVQVAAATNVTYTAPTDGDYYYFNIDVKSGSGSAQLTSCKVYYEKATPLKPLKSIVVSGTPTKTTYEAGDSFNPAGLVATGTYDDLTTGDITKDVEWTITPSSLTVGTTSVSVVAKVGEISSEAYVVEGLTVTAVLPTISITKGASGVTGSYSSKDFTIDDVSFHYINWMSSTDFIQAQASTVKSLCNNTPIPGYIKKIQVVTGSGKTARAVTIKAGKTSNYNDMVSIAAPATSMDMTFDFGDSKYKYFCLATPGNACYFDKIIITYEQINDEPTISCPDIDNVSYEGLTDAQTTATFTNADGWTSSVTCDGTVVTSASIDGSKVVYSVSENTGNTDREGSFTIKLSKEGNEDITKIVKVAQSHFAVDYVTLPFEWAGGASSLFTKLDGVTTSGLGSDYAASNAPYLIKLDGTGDYFQFKTNEPIGLMSVDVKMLGGNDASSLKVQGSADGNNWSDIETLSISGAQNDVLNLKTTSIPDKSYRYVKFVFTKGSNVGVGAITINAPQTQPVDITPVGYATAFIPFNATISNEANDVKAYYVTVSDDKAQLNEIEGTIPANTGVVLKGSAGTATFTESAVEPTTDVSGNKMVGTLTTETFSDKDFVYYRLANNNGSVGFYKQNADGSAECAAGKAVLAVPASAVAPTSFTFDDATAINAISNVKTSSVRYNLNGQAVGEDYKGIVIVNGKKMFNK